MSMGARIGIVPSSARRTGGSHGSPRMFGNFNQLEEARIRPNGRFGEIGALVTGRAVPLVFSFLLCGPLRLASTLSRNIHFAVAGGPRTGRAATTPGSGVRF